MPQIKFSVPHQLSVLEASNRLKNAITDLKAKFGDRIQNLSESWNSNEGRYSFEVMGFRVAGEITVSGNSVEFSGNVPISVLPFKSVIESTAKEHIKTLLS
jgi:hypothetical protein